MTGCARYEDDLALYVEGDLPASGARTVEAHLESCPACRGFLGELRVSQGAVKALAAEPLDEDALAVVRRAVASRRAYRPVRLPAAWRWAIAAGLVAAASGWWLTRPRVPVPEATVPTAIQIPTPPAVDATPEEPRMAARPVPAPTDSRKRSRVSARPTFGLSHEDADQLARAVVALSRVERVDEEAGPSPAGPEPAPLVQIATGDPTIAIYWRLDTNGGEQ